MSLLLFAMAALALGGVSAALLPRPQAASRLGAAGILAAAALGIPPCLGVLSGGPTASLALGWSLPGARLTLVLDPLAAFFLLPILGLSAAAAIYGVGYLRDEKGARRVGLSWLWLALLVASMSIVVLAGNALLFLVAWEVMALSSYFLVIFHHERAEVRRAGWRYLVATHLGTACLILLFSLLAGASGSLEFADWSGAAPMPSLLLALALLGFGSKAGIVPAHVWLPDAHPAAPSHVSAVMSGVMIKTGIYGLLRFLLWVGGGSASWAYLLIGLGIASGLLGVLLALAQHDLKRLLAYHSVENIGIIVLALGLGMLASRSGAPELAALALAGALLHVWNHALFKGLLFLAVGSVARAAGTLDLEKLGGLLSRMPWTGATFLVGAAAISALPPLNGFVSEFLIYLAAFRGAWGGGVPLPGVLASVAGLALIGGLAAACFAKASGVTFLGVPRSAPAAAASEVGATLRISPVLLALTCLVLGLAGPLGLAAAAPAVSQLLGETAAAQAGLASAAPVLWKVGAVGAGTVLLAVLLGALRTRLARRVGIRREPTWGCGYARPTPRMQYTASSFAQPLTGLFGSVLGMQHQGGRPRQLDPEPARFSSHARDLGLRIWTPPFEAIARLARAVRPLQDGSTHHYVAAVIVAAAIVSWMVL